MRIFFFLNLESSAQLESKHIEVVSSAPLLSVICFISWFYNWDLRAAQYEGFIECIGCLKSRPTIFYGMPPAIQVSTVGSLII